MKKIEKVVEYREHLKYSFTVDILKIANRKYETVSTNLQRWQ